MPHVDRAIMEVDVLDLTSIRDGGDGRVVGIVEARPIYSDVLPLTTVLSRLNSLAREDCLIKIDDEFAL